MEANTEYGNHMQLKAVYGLEEGRIIILGKASQEFFSWGGGEHGLVWSGDC